MNKKAFLLLAIVAIHTSVYAQYEKWSAEYTPLSKYAVLDTAYLRVTYHFIHLFDTDDPTSRRPDTHTLLIGRKYSKYFSQTYVDYCEARDAKLPADGLPPQGTVGMEIFKDYPRKGVLTATQLGWQVSFGANLKYEEELPDIRWQMEEGTDTLLFYPCKKATTTFRGRDYVAWFAPEIPIPNGPWKFGGLPGLILKVADTELGVSFECTGIERTSYRKATRLGMPGEGGSQTGGKAETYRPALIKFYDAGFRETTRKEMADKIRAATTNLMKYWRDNGIEVGVGSPIPPIPYNPIERD